MKEDRLLSLWIKQKHNELSPDEQTELKELISSQPDEAITREMLEFIWNAPLNAYPPENLSTGHWDRIEEQLHEPLSRTTRKLSFKRWKWAAVAACFAGIGLFYWYNREAQYNNSVYSGTQLNKVITQPDSKSQIELPDGTTVWLNKGSKLTYSNNFFGEKHREVTLVGEAFFDVRRNESVPFVISTNDMKITVKGTAFNVKAYPGAKTVETSLLRGLIEISTRMDPDRKILLKPHEKFILSLDRKNPDAAGGDGIHKDSTSGQSFIVTRLNSVPGAEPNETAWMNQRLYFNDNRLDELVPKLESWYNVKINFGNDSLKKMRFSGVVEKETIEELLNLMQMSVPFKYKISNDQVWLGQ